MTYWTGTWDPAKEAISKEIAALRVGARARAPVVSISPGQSSRFDRRHRAVVLSGRAWPALRLIAAVVEPRADVTHIFGGQMSWHLVRALGRRPIVLTAVTSRTSDERLPHVNFARVVVQTADGIVEWLDAGVPRDRIEVLSPGIDLEWFVPAPPPSGRFTLLFASTPSDAADLEGRGIPLLADLARHRPDIDVLVPWRQWGDLAAARRALQGLDPVPNFIVEHGDIVDMRTVFGRAHATIAPFAPGVGKTVPNFVIEGLASGRPCISTPGGGLASLIEPGAGLVVARDVAALADAIDRVRDSWSDWSRRARQLAETSFNLVHVRARYDQIYREVASAATT